MVNLHALYDQASEAQKRAFHDYKAKIENTLGRHLSELELRKILWLAGWEKETADVIVSLICEGR